MAELWRRIAERPLLAVIGPSGAGKTSFLRAGMIPHAPAGWRVVICTPGQSPFGGLAQALLPQFAGDTEGTGRLFQIHDPEVALRVAARWRLRCDHALIVVDQFEELFTLNSDEVQARFADVLGRIAVLDGLHVLLSIRDDFFFLCSSHDGVDGSLQRGHPAAPADARGLA